MQPRTANAASDAMKRTTIAISKKVNVPRVNTFKAAAIATEDKKPNFGVTKKIDNIHVTLFWEDRLRNVVSGS
jgi:hypothetical protein